jgi:hypothetical protein
MNKARCSTLDQRAFSIALGSKFLVVCDNLPGTTGREHAVAEVTQLDSSL